ncbi:MAG TPA: hypothetical protein VL547_16580 [Dinghuibacter sp.]|uniref:hypothetical protein n=1 Tax=Dinghuibacter sp. TaxID=2024697 RepID=UPI002B92E8B6|nr:hypothetical protein [Dinghuibacter sp.]HTJ13655.1 hypothetical protein [Dinghuibacter sp.]
MVKGILGLALLVLVTIPSIRCTTPRHKGQLGPEKTWTTVGVIKGFTANAHLDINAVELRVPGGAVSELDFYPHNASAVIAGAGPGDSVRVTFAEHRLHSLRNLQSGREIAVDQWATPMDIPPNRRAEYFTIQHPDIVLNPKGNIVALRSGRRLFHFKAGSVDDLRPFFKNSPQLGLSAVWRDDQFGFVNINHDTVYVVLSVTADSKTFLVR